MLGAAQQKAPRVLRGWFRLKAAVKVEFERKMEELFRWLRFYAALRCCWVIQPGTQQAMLALKRVPSQTSGKWFCLWFLPYLRNGWAVSHRLTRANISVLRMNHAVEVLNPWYLCTFLQVCFNTVLFEVCPSLTWACALCLYLITAMPKEGIWDRSHNVYLLLSFQMIFCFHLLQNRLRWQVYLSERFIFHCWGSHRSFIHIW